MVNNTIFARVCIVTLLLFISNFSFSQNISKYYTARHQENSIMYFIHDLNGFSNNRSEFHYDITYLSNSDSATFNFTFITRNEIKIDSISLFNNDQIFSSVTKKLFIEPKKNKWIYRHSARFAFKDLDTFFSKGTPAINLISGVHTLPLSISAGKWNKQQAVVKKIFSLINQNR